MIINGYPCAYQDYGKRIIVFSNASRSHFIIQDIYAEFFRLCILQNNSKEFVIHKISQEYGVAESVVSQDFDRFTASLTRACSPSVPCSNPASAQLVVKDSDIYSLMSQDLVPFSATIEITDTCNLKCIHCYRGHPFHSYWTAATFEQALLQLRQLGTLHLTLTGGEPFTHPDFRVFPKLIKKYGFVLTLQTNATFDFSELYDSLVDISLKDIAVSLYSTIYTVHDAITTIPGSCQKTMKALTQLAARGFPVTINCPVMTINQGSLQSVKEFADSIGASCHFSFKIIPCQETKKDTLQLNCFTADLLQQYMVDSKIKLYHDILPSIRQCIPGERYCQTGFRSITLNAQGSVMLCNAYRKSCGNLKNSSLKQIWTSSDALLRWRTTTSLINKTCKNCKAFAYCEPCPAHEFTLTGNEFTIDSLTCSFGKAFYEADQCILARTKGGEKNEGV